MQRSTFGTLGSLPSFDHLLSNKSSFIQLPDPPLDKMLRPPPLTESWSRLGKNGSIPKVNSASSLDSLVLDDTVQFCVPSVPDLLATDLGKPLSTSCESLGCFRDVMQMPKLESFPQIKPEVTEFSAQPRPYPPDVRRAKIARYKAKLLHRRAKVPISRHFAGRSNVAKSKTRVNGKFTRKN